MLRKVSKNFRQVRQSVEGEDVVVSLYVEEEDRLGQSDPDLKVYLATAHQAELLKDALCEKRGKGSIKFNSIIIRSRGAYDLSIGNIVAIVRM